jgi:hypothetical protein
MNPIEEHARTKGSKKVNYSFIPEQGPLLDGIKDVEPEEIATSPFAISSAELYKDEEDRAIFMTYIESNSSVFFDVKNVPAESNPKNRVQIIMEPTKTP